MADSAPTPMVTRSIYLSETLASQIDSLSAEERRSFSNYIVVILENHVARVAHFTPAVRQPKAA